MHLKAKAQQARGQMLVNRTLNTGPAVLLPETGVDELAVFGGQTQVLVSKILSQKSRKSRGASPVSASSASSPSAVSEESPTPSDPVPEVHPSLVEYLSMLPPPTTPSPKSSAGSVPTQFHFNQNTVFQPDTFTNVFPTMTPGSSSCQQTFSMSTSTPAAFDEQFMRSFADTNFFGPPSSTEAVSSGFDNLELLISGEGGVDERWTTLMQDMLNPSVP